MNNSRLILLTVFACVLLAGCQTLPPSDETDNTGGKGAEPPPPQTGVVLPAEPSQPMNMRRVMVLLQDGQLVPARAGLVDILEREPNNPTARSLLRQLDSDPVALLGSEHTLYTVRSGDTLGALAAQYLGDATSFLALARYNGISRPRLLQAGQTIKIPTQKRRSEAAAEAPSATPEVQPEAQSPAAPSMPQEAASPSAPAVPAAESSLPDLEERTPSGATPTPAVAPADGHTPPPDDTTAKPADGPATPPAQTDTRAPTEARVTELHEAAVVHYRNQQLDDAIGLWDEVLALDPDFEPAQSYRNRALELKRRLRELDSN